MRLGPLLLALLLAAPAAQADTRAPLLAAVRADDWGRAALLAADEPDPLARKLVLYYHLLAPGGARAAEIAAFMAESPDWPQQWLLSRRLQEALAVDKDDATVLAICRQRPPTAIPSLLRCADAAERAGTPTPADLARQAWVTGITDAPHELSFLRRWGTSLTPDDQARRFDRLAWSESPAPGGPAARQAVRLPPALRPAAEARLALRRDDATAPAIVAALPEAMRNDPAMVLELARWYRRAGQDRDAVRVWTGPGVAAETSAPVDRTAAFWAERNRLARELLRAGEPRLAFDLVAAPAGNPEGALDQSFLAGWIALRRLDEPAKAASYFQTLQGLSASVITQSRAWYWLGRAATAAHDDPAARAAYETAATWPTTYYGQLAVLALGGGETALASRVAAAQDPAWDPARALAFLARDSARAAVLLAAWGEKRRAKTFIARLDETAADSTDRALAARLALELGLPEQAVAVARRAGRDGVMLPGAGWPAPVDPPTGTVEPAIVLGLIRQESSFDIQAASPVGARGLMQLMPATAAAVARKLGLAPDVPALTQDAGYNMRLGVSYLEGLLTRFDQALPLALAGYNAGPGRVRDWLVAQDPRAGADAMIDWIELIPFNETRNYVQRVIENVVIYRARLGAAAPHPVEAARG